MKVAVKPVCPVSADASEGLVEVYHYCIFMISEWVKGDHITLVRNPHYTGLWKPYLKKIVLNPSESRSSGSTSALRTAPNRKAATHRGRSRRLPQALL